MRRAFHVTDRKALITEERDGLCFVGAIDLDAVPKVRTRIDWDLVGTWLLGAAFCCSVWAFLAWVMVLWLT